MNKKIHVKILTPNGRKVDIEISSYDTVLEALKQVCEKQKFNADDYDLKHLKKILDVNTTFGYANIPNNANLEMIPCKNKRLKSKESFTTVRIQLVEENKIFEKNFLSTVSLEFIFTDFGIDYKPEDFIVDLTKRIFGNEFQSKTLQSLGYENTKVSFRFVKNSSEDQAFVYVPSKPKILKSEESLENKSSESKLPLNHNIEESSKNESADSIPLEENKPLKKTNNKFFQNNSVDFVSLIKAEKTKFDNKEKCDISEDKSEVIDSTCNPKMIKDVKIEHEKMISEVKIEHENIIQDVKIEQEKIKTNQQISGDIEKFTKILDDERKALLFNRNDVKSLPKYDDLSDEFFEPTLTDIILMQKDNQKAVEKLNNKPLSTSEHKKLLKEKEVQEKFEKYAKTLIRIYFPNQLVLQALFNPDETVNTIKRFIRMFLKNAEYEFVLYTSPPRKDLNPQERLIDLDLVPSANIYYSGSSDLQSEVQSTLTDPEHVELLTAKIRESIIKTDFKKDSSLSVNTEKNTINFLTNVVEENIPIQYQEPQAPQLQPQPHSSQTSIAKVPKWFKPIGK